MNCPRKFLHQSGSTTHFNDRSERQLMPPDRDDTGVDRVEYATREARATLDQQIEKIHREDEKAVKMARVNLIIFGFVLSSLSIVFQSESLTSGEFLNLHNALGAFGVGLSTLLAGMTYSSSRFEMGISPSVIEDALEMDEQDFYENVADFYSDWISANKTVHKSNAHAMRWVIVFSILGLFFLLVGFAVGVAEIKGDAVSYVVLAVELVIAVGTVLLVTKSDTVFEILLEDN